MDINNLLVKYAPSSAIRSIPAHVRAVDWIAEVMTTDESTVLFGAMNGDYYGDNSRHLFEWTIENRPDLNPVWLTRNQNVHTQLTNEGKPVENIFSFSGIKMLYRAKVGVFTNSLYDISPHPIFVPKTLKLIALRHGRSVKRIRFARKNHKLSSWERKQRLKESELIEYAISTSEFISDLQEECLQIGREKHIVTGYPRNDDLIDPPETSRKVWSSFTQEISPDHTILYAPTWRHGRKPTQFFPFNQFDVNTLVSILEEHNTQLLLRPHVNDYNKFKTVRENISSLSDQSPYIRKATHNEFADVNSILPFVDILISDYSAIYHDFLLLDRPMILIPYDFEDFKHNNGFLYDYYGNVPGPTINSFDQFTEYILSLLNGNDPHQQARLKLYKKIHEFDDDQSNQRIINLIDKTRE